jgi:hypothetical protein
LIRLLATADLDQTSWIFAALQSIQACRVQVALCSSFCAVIEAAGDLLAPYLEHVFHTVMVALSQYQGRSLLLLFGSQFPTVYTLAVAVSIPHGTACGRPNLDWPAETRQ